MEEEKEAISGAVHVLPLQDYLQVLDRQELGRVVELGKVGADEPHHLLHGVLAQEPLTKPVPLVPVLDCQGGDDEVTANLGQEIDAKVLGHLQLLLQYVLVSSGSPSVGQLNDGGDHLGAVGEAVLRLLRHQVLEVGAEGHHHDGVDLEDCTIAGLQGPVRELVRLLQIVELQAVHTLHSSLTVALGIPEHDNVTKPNIDWMQITNLIFLSFILDEEVEVISFFSVFFFRLANVEVIMSFL